MPSPRRGKRPRVVLCAALTVDGKLDAREPALSPMHFPWASRGETDAVLPPLSADADLTAQLHQLRREDGVRRVFCTGDATAFRAFLDAGVVTELWLALRPRVDGRRDAPTLGGPPGADWFPASLACRLVRMEMREDECLLRYRMTGDG